MHLKSRNGLVGCSEQISTTLASALATAALIAVATLSQAHAATFTNGNFEGGVYSSTIGGYTNNSVPNGWSSSISYDYRPEFNFVYTAPTPLPAGTTNDLSIGNYDYDTYTPATLTQTFTDVSGQTYNVSFYAYYGGGAGGDSGAFLTISVGSYSTTLTDLTATDAWALYSFSFVGTGSDTMTISAQTNPSEWYVDDITTGVAATPLPAALPLFASGLGALGLFGWRRKRKASAAIAG